MKRGLPLAIVAVAVAWQYRAPLLGRVWFFEDIAAYFVPLYSTAGHSMRNGVFPTWALGAWSGQPLVGDPQLALFYPPNWIWMLLHPARAYAWLQLFHVAVGAAGMWTLARGRGRSTAAAAVAALSLALGAFCVLELRHAMFVATTAWMPWLLVAVDRLAARRSVDHVLLVAVMGALAILGGGWSMLVFGVAVVAVYVVAAIARSDDKARLAALLAAGGALAVALAMVQIVPAVAHGRLSPRALGVTPAFASSYGWPSWRYALTLFLPTLYGDDARGTYVGAPDQWELAGYGIGVAGGLLALASLRLRERRGERIALLVASLLACELARGKSGFVHPLLLKLPLFSSLRCPARALYVYTLAAPILAADGFDALFADDGALRRVGARALAVLRPLVVVAVALELAITFRAENPSTTRAVADAHPQAIDWLLAYGRPGRATNDVHLGNAMHNFGLRWRYESAGGYHSLPIWRYLHLLWIANHGRPYPHARLDDDLTGQGLWRFSSPIVNLLSVQWVIAPRDRPIDVPGWTRAFAGDDGVDVWHNARAFPRAFVVYGAEHVADEAAAARAVASPTWNPARSAVVERDVGLPSPADGPLPLPNSPTQFVREGPTTLVLDVTAPRRALVVVAEPWYPGWHATVDGQPAELLRVDYALRGVVVDAGEHVVALELTCVPLQVGACVTFAALAIVAALAWRRRRAAAA